LEQGCFLSHLTLRLLQIVQDRGFNSPLLLLGDALLKLMDLETL
jgi:hypothetical protein